MDKKKLIVVFIIAVLVVVAVVFSFREKETGIKGFGASSMENIKAGDVILSCEDANWLANKISLFLDEKFAQEDELKKTNPNAKDNETLDYLAKNMTPTQILFQDEVKKLQLEVGGQFLSEPKKVDAVNEEIGKQIVFIYQNIFFAKSGQATMTDVDKSIRDAFCTKQ